MKKGDLIKIKDGFDRDPVYLDGVGVFIAYESEIKHGRGTEQLVDKWIVFFEGKNQAFDEPYWKVVPLEFWEKDPAGKAAE